VVLAILAALGASAGAQTSDRSRAESQSRRAGERLLALQREADALATQQRTLLADLRRLELERDLKNEQVEQLDAASRKMALELGNIANQIDALEAETEAARPVLAARMVELYKLGRAGYVRLLFNVSNLKEFGRGYRMVAAAAAIDRSRAERQKENVARLRTAQGTLKTRRAELAKLQQAAVAARAAAERAATTRAQLIVQIDQRRDLTAELAGELQAAQARLQQTLGAIAAGAPRPAGEASALPIRPFRGDLEWPVAGGRMLTSYGRGGSTVGRPAQSGVQIAAQEGSPVIAVHDGTIAFVGPFTGYGTLVIVDHGAQTFSLYGQLGAAEVERGAKVERGQVVGAAGRILAGIPGLYFEMRVDGKPVDPLEWLRKR
jgi:septal ring factor EnvC (AmiA/AmiB activator)